MTSSDDREAPKSDLLVRARELLADGYKRATVTDETRARELIELYEEIGQEVVVLRGALPADGQECDGCLDSPGIVTLFVRDRRSPAGR